LRFPLKRTLELRLKPEELCREFFTKLRKGEIARHARVNVATAVGAGRLDRPGRKRSHHCVLTVLYLGRVVLEPLAIPVLLAFVLTPPIRRLRGLFLGRVTSVIAVVGFALAILVALGFVMETQISRLAGEIPKYQQNLREKISSLNKALVSSGTLQQASSTLDSLASELGGKGPNSSPQGQAGKANQQPAPIPVEVQKPQSATLQNIEELLSPIIEPISMAGLLVLFLVFILFYREDLRDRILRLGGTRDLQTTTAAMNDAGRRLSRYFLIQASINGCFGLFIGAALWIIGVPNFIFWGMLAGILRFVPYVGTPMAAVFPLALASAIILAGRRSSKRRCCSSSRKS
jgi:predicted PurR-regulated permease PerM